MQEALRRDNVSDEVGEKEKERRPRRTKNVPPSSNQVGSVADMSLESPVDDSDNDKDFKCDEEESSDDVMSKASDDDMPDPNANTKKTKAGKE